MMNQGLTINAIVFNLLFVGSASLADSPPPLPAPSPTPTQASQVKPAIEYYVGLNGQKDGPFTLDNLIARAQKGTLSADDLVWKTGLSDWVKAASLEELKSAFDSANEVTYLRKNLTKGWWSFEEDEDGGRVHTTTYFYLKEDGTSWFGQNIKYSFEPVTRIRTMQGQWNISDNSSKSGFNLLINSSPSSVNGPPTGITHIDIDERYTGRTMWAFHFESINWAFRMGVNGILEEKDGTAWKLNENCPCQ